LDNSIELRNYMRSGTGENNYRAGRWRSFYAILVDPRENKVVDAEPPPPLGATYPTENTAEGLLRVYPINSSGEERVWRNYFPSGKKLATTQKLVRSERGTIKQKIAHEERRRTLFSNWTDSKYNAGTHGTNVLSALGLGGEFDYPKSVWTTADGLWALTFGNDSALVLDYFGGSGTTGHAVMAMNREDGGSRKYVLVEMGAYFDAVLKARLQKVAFADKWEDGLPLRHGERLNPFGGTSHCLKVLRLESYEDTLDNVEFDSTQAPGTELGLEFKRDYELRYALDWESRDCPTQTERFLSASAVSMPAAKALSLKRLRNDCKSPAGVSLQLMQTIG
jgi:adenine-specific DNA-methyltransferase